MATETKKGNRLAARASLSDDKYENGVIIGQILRTHREKEGIMQRTVSEELGYRNPNYVSMIESGRTSIPMARIADVVKAYQIDPSFALVILKGLYPECFEMAFTIVENTKANSRVEACKKAEELISELVVKHNVRLPEHLAKSA